MPLFLGHFLLGLALVALDQATKAWVRRTFVLGETRPLIDGILHLTYVRNTGAAFGLLQGQGPLLIAITLALGALAFTQRAKWRRARPGERLALTLAVSGALGNLIDRVWLGWVTDFVDLRVWPVFNVADATIFVGVLLFAWHAVVRPERGAGCRA